MNRRERKKYVEALNSFVTQNNRELGIVSIQYEAYSNDDGTWVDEYAVVRYDDGCYQACDIDEGDASYLFRKIGRAMISKDIFENNTARYNTDIRDVRMHLMK